MQKNVLKFDIIFPAFLHILNEFDIEYILMYCNGNTTKQTMLICSTM